MQDMNPEWKCLSAAAVDSSNDGYNKLMIHEKEGIYKLYTDCYKDNLHSIWAGQELYRKGNNKEKFYTILQKNMQPVYDSARRQGYEVWNTI